MRLFNYFGIIFTVSKPIHKTMRKHYLISSFFILLLSLSGCQSIKKSYDSRNYDQVVRLFLEKKKISDEEISLFEKAYAAVLERDKEKIKTLKSLNNGDRWEEIFDIYSAIQTRQNAILKVLPLYYSDGRKASIETFDLSAALEESRQNAAQSYYDQGLKLLNSGKKQSIRQSLEYFSASRKFYINYKDVNELMEIAMEKGKNYALLIVDKNPMLLLPPSFEQSIVDQLQLTQKDQWVHLDYREKSGINYDYIVKLNLYSIQVSPESVKEIHTTEEKRVEDGWQYVLDERGNVKKDSLGNDIKIPKYKTIQCKVKEVRMQKTAQVFGDATIYDGFTKSFVRSTKCTGNAAYNYSFYEIFGDKQALSTATLQKLHLPPGVFPNTFEMVEQSKNELIRCYQDFISRNYQQLAYIH